MHTTCLTYASIFPLVHTLQIACHHPVLSCPAASVFLHLYLKPHFYRSISQVYFFHLLPLLPCSVHTCLLLLLSLLLSVSPVQFHFLFSMPSTVIFPTRNIHGAQQSYSVCASNTEAALKGFLRYSYTRLTRWWRMCSIRAQCLPRCRTHYSCLFRGLITCVTSA